MKDIRTLWKARAIAKEINSFDLAAYAIYKSLYLEEDLDATKTRLRKSFSPVHNVVKLANGAEPFFMLRAALRMVKHSAIADWLTPEEFAPLYERATLLVKEAFK